jgi:hypothetical protein
LALVLGRDEVSAPVVALMKGVLNAMLVSKMKTAALVLLTVAAVGAGTWALAYPYLVAQQPRQQNADPPRVADPGPKGTGRLPPAAEGEYKMAALDEARVKELLEAAKVSDKLRALLKGQYEAALAETTARWEEFIAGRGTLDLLFGASLRLLEAERALSDKKADQVVALENQWKRMRVMEGVNQARFDAGRVPIAELSQTKFYRIQAEIWLERARGK